MSAPHFPVLFQINTRVWLTEMSRKLGRHVTLDDVSDDDLDQIAGQGVDWVWLLSVWQTGLASREVSRTDPALRREFQLTLPDLTDDDIPGSGFAITSYTTHQQLGGDAALSQLRERLAERGVQLMLDFVPNHTALDHPWVESHPEYYIQGSEQDLAANPQNYRRIQHAGGDFIFALGRDPYFPGWKDVLQLNYGNPGTRAAMQAELLSIADKCDGVRCDMAMLILPEVFQRTWGIASEPFWPEAISHVLDRFPNFCFMAEAYWDMEWTLQQQGFHYTYDKRLYDRLRDGQAKPVREHLQAGLDYQEKLARFLENHDEPRAAATFPFEMHRAAAVLTYLSPGLKFFHQGQFEGRKVHVSPHLGRAPEEPTDAAVKEFYDRLLKVLRLPAVRDGQWRLLECVPAWEGNPTAEDFIACQWELDGGEHLIVVVNFSPHQSQCRLPLDFPEVTEHDWRLRDQLSSDVYDRNGKEIHESGLYLDMVPWQAAIYQLEPLLHQE